VTLVDVLQVVASTDRRGAETFALDLETLLERHSRSVATVALAPGRAQEQLDVPALARSRLSPRALYKLRVRAREAKVVIAHGSTTLVACALALPASRTPFVYRSIGDPRYWSGSPVRRIRTSTLLRAATQVVALTGEARDDLHQRLGVSPEKLRVIPNGVPASHFPATDARRRANLRRDLGLPQGAPVAVVVGALSAEKDPALALSAAAEVPDLQLIFVGDGPLRSELTRLAATIAPGRVRLLGALEDPSPLLGAADVAVCSSRTEGLPAALIEAGMTGLPVVTTDVGLVREIVVDGETGFVVPYGTARGLADAIGRALEERDQLGAAARARCLDRFELEHVGNAWAQVVAELIDG
jgi:glycosyltransferase involved in cell wall biosynthesis